VMTPVRVTPATKLWNLESQPLLMVMPNAVAEPD
jgi:hypothetical protein